jgi:hypothetical protein
MPRKDECLEAYLLLEESYQYAVRDLRVLFKERQWQALIAAASELRELEASVRAARRALLNPDQPSSSAARYAKPPAESPGLENSPGSN